MTWLDQIKTAFSDRVLPITDKNSVIWAEMRAKAENKGNPLPVIDGLIIDGLIAATAHEHDLILVTSKYQGFCNNRNYHT